MLVKTVTTKATTKAMIMAMVVMIMAVVALIMAVVTLIMAVTFDLYF